ncbi:uncharacterized protein V1518DRAFT_414772, partial [Limtongia smithiae]|uniref:uncharacterized protein n=1 Tax=Limtongia smithiae TaxID=1125753 RepID=UPI0034CD225B
MTSSASSAFYAPTIKDKPSAVRHFFDKPVRRNSSLHVSGRIVSNGTSVSGQSSLSSSSSSSSSAVGTANTYGQRTLVPETTLEKRSERVDALSIYSSRSRGLNRSHSMRGPRAPPLELNAASLDHVKRLLHQLLQKMELSPKLVARWERALLPILLQATDDLDLDVRGGDAIDVRNFVKVKRIPGATPDDTVYLSGVAFTKNLALKSMPREISGARIMLLAFPLDYIREEPPKDKKHTAVATSVTSDTSGEGMFVFRRYGNRDKLLNGKPEQLGFMSLNCLDKETEHLENVVKAIAARRPHLVLLEQQISGHALQLLQKANIAVAYNVNPNVIRAVARSALADIVTSADDLLNDVENETATIRVGTCENVEVKTYVFDAKTKKTFIFMSGCPPQLGCTIVLRGGDMKTLGQIKVITKFMSYVIYNLKLETHLMREEMVLVPAPDQLRPTVYSGNSQMATDDIDLILDDDTGYYDALVKLHSETIVCTSPYVQIPQPHLLWRARYIEKRLQILNKTAEEFDKQEHLHNESTSELIIVEKDSEKSANEKIERPDDKDIEDTGEAIELSEKYKYLKDRAEITMQELIRPEVLAQLPGGGKVILPQICRALLKLESDKLNYIAAIQKRQWEAYLAHISQYLFDPFAYQHITILYSLISEITTAPCTGPELVSIQYYGEGDCTLGQFIEGICDSFDQQCSDGCSYTLAQHYRSYVHGNGRVNVFVEKHPPRFPGMEHHILMWSHCTKCDITLQPSVMSEESWKYSFGKYLERSFWSAPLSMRGDLCHHDFHKDHIRIFGVHGLAVKFEYKDIELLEISFPRTQLLWKPQIDVRLRAEEYCNIVERINKYFDSVLMRLTSVRVDEFSSIDRTEECKAEIEIMCTRAQSEQTDLKLRLQDLYQQSSYREYLPLNAVIRSLQECVVQWDLDFAEFDRNFFPSEKDITRLTAIQLKKMFLERDTTANTMGGADDNTESSTPAVDLTSAVELMPVQSNTSQVSISPVLTATASSGGDYLESHAPALTTPEFAAPLGFPSPGLSSIAAVQRRMNKVTEVPPGTFSNDRPKLTGLSVAPIIPNDAQMQRAASEPVLPVSEAQDEDKMKKTVSSIAAPVDENTLSSKNSVMPSPPPPMALLPPPMLSADTDTVVVTAQAAARSKPTTANTNSLRRKVRPDNLILPPATQFRHRLTQGTTRELARQLQLNRGGDVHGPPTSVAGVGSSFAVGQSKVISLARHFDQLSREFEKERARERKKLAQGRLRAVGSSKPIVEVIYQNIEDAVEEDEDDDDDMSSDDLNSDDELFSDSGTIGRRSKTRRAIAAEKKREFEAAGKTTAETVGESSSKAPVAGGSTKSTAASSSTAGNEHSSMLHSESESDSIAKAAGKTPSETDSHTELLDPAQTVTQEHDAVQEQEPQAQLSPSMVATSTQPASASDHPFQQELPPVPEKLSLMTMLSNFWADRSASGWQPLDYPLQPSEHIFMDSDVIVREDEPSSVIAFCLSSPDYIEKLEQIRRDDDQMYETSSDDEVAQVSSQPNSQIYARQRTEKPDGSGGYGNGGSGSAGRRPRSREDLERWLLKETGTHLKYQFQEGTAKLSCKIFYAELFDAFRSVCGCDDYYIQSLSRCIKWDSTGGKSGSAFLKTLDDRLVVKQLSPSELDAFIKFAPSYFQYMAQVFFHDLPSVIAKIMGFYQVQVRNPMTNKSMKMDIIVMENLFYDRNLLRIFDLKGSMRNRHVEQTGKANEVLLDENMVEYIFESPLFVRDHAKNMLRASLWNDTLFLAKMNVMDYSLVIAIDPDRHQLVVGIIDCLRTFTWDKKLESWVKERGLVGGGGKVPTVVTPRQYKHRFREAMERYILMVP